MARVLHPIRGLGALGRGWLWENFIAADSDTSPAGPHPGSTIPDSTRAGLVVQISGEQSDDWVVQALSGGMPRLVQGCRVAYRKRAEATAQLRGWNPGSVLQDWVAGELGATLGQPPAACVIPSTQEVVTVWAASSVISRTYDPYTAAWSAAGTLVATTSGINHLCSVECLPGSERLFSVLVPAGNREALSFYSDDRGATWAPAGVNVCDTIFTGSWLRGRLYAVGHDLLFVPMLTTGGLTHVMQFASSDLGASFQLIVDWTPGGLQRADVVPLRSGKIGVVTIDVATNRPYWRTVASVWEPFNGAIATEIDATQTVSEVAACVDKAGAVWLFARNLAQSIHVWRSDDEGATWHKSSVGLFESGDAATYPTNMMPTPSAGAIQVVHQWAAAPSTTFGFAVMPAGGWSNVTMDVSHVASTAIVDLDSERCGFGPTAVGGVTTYTWAPMDLPQDNGWTKTGAATTTLTSGWNEIVAVAQQGYYTPPTTPTMPEYFMGIWSLMVVSGGATATNDIAIQLEMSDGVDGHQIVVRFKDDTIRVRDLVSGTNTDVAVDCTDPIQLKVVARRGSAGQSYLEVFWRRPGASLWTNIVSSVMGTTVLAAGLLRYGTIANATATSRWRLVAVSWGWPAAPWNYAGSPNALYDDIFGRQLVVQPYPLGDTALDGASFVSASDGPATIAESHSIPVTYDFGPERLFIDVSPSPGEPWRSTDELERTFVLAPSGGSRVTSLGSRTLVMAVRRANVRTVHLEGDAGAGYVLLGTIDLAIGFSAGLTALASGDVIDPNTATTAQAGRYLQRAESVGGTVVCNGIYARILQQEEGLWTQSLTRRPRLVVDRLVTSGAFTLIHHSGVVVIHNVSTAYQKFRIRIPAQSTADGYFDIGSLGVFALAPVGAQWSNGWSYELRQQTTYTKNRRGTERGFEDGPRQRVVSFAFPDGVKLDALRSSVPVDYLSADAAHVPLAARRDVPWQLGGVLEESRGGAVAVCLVMSVPEVAAYTTITDPTLWLVGLLKTGLAVRQVVGAEGVSEYVTVETTTIEELVG
jgi:hypothetical protein